MLKLNGIDILFTKKGEVMAKTSIPELFGSMVFNKKVMKERLPKDVFCAVEKAINGEERLSSANAIVVAEAMKNWAIEKGATHFTHWFQPMTGITAQKHDSFIEPSQDGEVIMTRSRFLNRNSLCSTSIAFRTVRSDAA